MLYETFNSLKEAHGQDYFTSRIDSDFVQNLNSKFELREYQKRALGRFADFIMILKKRNRTISIYQIFIEPKGDQFKDNQGRFESSKDGWKEKFLLEMEEKAETNLRIENKNFRLIGMPFYNEKLRQIFEEAFEAKILT